MSEIDRRPCPHCGVVVKARHDRFLRPVKCPKCKRISRFPKPETKQDDPTGDSDFAQDPPKPAPGSHAFSCPVCGAHLGVRELAGTGAAETPPARDASSTQPMQAPKNASSTQPMETPREASSTQPMHPPPETTQRQTSIERNQAEWNAPIREETAESPSVIPAESPKRPSGRFSDSGPKARSEQTLGLFDRFETGKYKPIDEEEEEGDTGSYSLFVIKSKNREMIPLLMEVKGINRDEAERLFNEPIIQIATGLSHRKASLIRDRFKAIGVSVNISSKD